MLNLRIPGLYSGRTHRMKQSSVQRENGGSSASGFTRAIHLGFTPRIAPSSALCHVMQCLLSQLVKCGYAQLKMFLFGVLDFVVTDSVQALDKHHHSRHSGSRDLGSVVEGSGGQSMHLSASLADCFGA